MIPNDIQCKCIQSEFSNQRIIFIRYGFYIALYPVRWTAQSALHFPPLADLTAVHSDTVLGFSWKHSSHAAIAQRLFTHISTTVYSQVLIYTAESTEASWSERKCPNFETVTTGIRTRALSIASPAFYQLSYRGECRGSKQKNLHAAVDQCDEFWTLPESEAARNVPSCKHSTHCPSQKEREHADRVAGFSLTKGPAHNRGRKC